METRASRSPAQSLPAMPSSRRLLLFGGASTGNDGAAIGAGDFRAAHAVRPFSTRRLPRRLDDRSWLEGLGCPAGPGERRRGPQLDLPFDVLPLVVWCLEVQERVWVLEQEPR